MEPYPVTEESIGVEPHYQAILVSRSEASNLVSPISILNLDQDALISNRSSIKRQESISELKQRTETVASLAAKTSKLSKEVLPRNITAQAFRSASIQILQANKYDTKDLQTFVREFLEQVTKVE